FTGGGTRRFPLNPVRVRAGVSGAALREPRSSLVDFALRVLAPDEPERAGLTAEADIPEFLEMAGGILSKDTTRRLKTGPFRASRTRYSELESANVESRIEISIEPQTVWTGRRSADPR